MNIIRDLTLKTCTPTHFLFLLEIPGWLDNMLVHCLRLDPLIKAAVLTLFLNPILVFTLVLVEVSGNLTHEHSVDITPFLKLPVCLLTPTLIDSYVIIISTCTRTHTCTHVYRTYTALILWPCDQGWSLRIGNSMQELMPDGNSFSFSHTSINALLVEVGTCAIFSVYVGISTTVINKRLLGSLYCYDSIHEYFVISVHII